MRLAPSSHRLSATTAAIYISHHNISPLPVKQLVLELEVRKATLEVFNRFPGSFRIIEAGPLDK
jgi:hypothetical protein